MAWDADLVYKLNADGLGTLGVDIFVGTKAQVPILVGSATVQVIETGGTTPEVMQDNVIAYEMPGAQITCRASTNALAKAKARAAWLSLNHRNVTINGTFYKSIRPNQTPFDGGIDARDQVLFQFNVVGEMRHSGSQS